MIANVGPSTLHFEESINTLKYANRAKNIKTTAKRNVVDVNYHITECAHPASRPPLLPCVPVPPLHPCLLADALVAPPCVPSVGQGMWLSSRT